MSFEIPKKLADSWDWMHAHPWESAFGLGALFATLSIVAPMLWRALMMQLYKANHETIDDYLRRHGHGP